MIKILQIVQKKSAKTILKLCVSITLITYVLSKINFIEVIEVLKSLNFVYYIFAILLALFGIFVKSYKWQTLLLAHDIEVHITKLSSFYIIGMFFNYFMPSSIGGDVSRIYNLAKHANDKINAATSVFMDRLSGLLALIMISIIALLFNYKMIDDPTIVIGVAGFLVITILVLVILFSKKIIKKFDFFYEYFFKKFRFLNLKNVVENLYDSILMYKSKKRILAKALTLSFIFQICAILSPYILSIALNLSIPLKYLFLVCPIAMILTMLPISIYGIGVRESVWIFFLAKVGLSSSEVLSLLLTGYSIEIVFVLVGGVIHLAMPLHGKYTKFS